MNNPSEFDKQKTTSDPARDKHHGVGHEGQKNGDSEVVNEDHAGLGAGGDTDRRDHPDRPKVERK